MTDGSENRTPQSSPPLSTRVQSGTEIRFRMESESRKLSQRTAALWGVKTLKHLQEVHQMFPDEADNYNKVHTAKSLWEPVPWWMFWKDGRRRWRRQWDGSGWKTVWEYQHVAFVAREALEDYCAPRSFAGEECATQQAPTQDRYQSANYVVGRDQCDRPSGS